MSAEVKSPAFVDAALRNAGFEQVELGDYLRTPVWTKVEEPGDRVTVICFVPHVGWGYYHWHVNTGKTGTRNAQWAESNKEWTPIDALVASQHEPGWSEYGKGR